MENEIIKLKIEAERGVEAGQVLMGQEGSDVYPIKVSIDQFYGIEINDFAVTVGKTALWIAESQMMKETEAVVHMNLEFLPLESNANIVEGSALSLDWGKVIDKSKLTFIMGNPPFLGYSEQDDLQKSELKSVFVDENGKPYPRSGKIDFVSAWYFKAAQFIEDTEIRVAFVSTNSITQGDQVAVIWEPLLKRFRIHLDFAWRTFKWDSESTDKAAVHCVIVGFSFGDNKRKKFIYANNSVILEAEQINPYLIDAPNVLIGTRKKPLCEVPEMSTGNRPADGGNLIIEADDYEDFIKKEPGAKKYIKKLTGAQEYINNKPRYCLWLVGVDPSEIKKMPLILKRVNACKQDRLTGAADRKKLADTPALFRETKNPKSYIIVPLTTSENRRYIPSGFLDEETVPSNSATIIPDATLYEFGILISNVHMAWMRTVAGRLKSDYRYSKDIVYNNFPWPEVDEKQKQHIEKTAQDILDARALYPDSSLADLYDETLMPPELRKAHQMNDKAVLGTYGMPTKIKESECVARLMEMYQELAEKK